MGADQQPGHLSHRERPPQDSNLTFTRIADKMLPITPLGAASPGSAGVRPSPALGFLPVIVSSGNAAQG